MLSSYVLLSEHELPNAAESAYTDTGKEAPCVQHLGFRVTGTAVEVGAKDNPTARREHGVFPGEDLAKDPRRKRSQDAAKLQDGCKPPSAERGLNDSRKVIHKSVHYEGLAKDALLIAIFESTEPMRVQLISRSRNDCFGSRGEMNAGCGYSRGKECHDKQSRVRPKDGPLAARAGTICMCARTAWDGVLNDTDHDDNDDDNDDDLDGVKADYSANWNGTFSMTRYAWMRRLRRQWGKGGQVLS